MNDIKQYTIENIEEKKFKSKAGKDLHIRKVFCTELPDDWIDASYFSVWNNYKTDHWNENTIIEITQDMIEESEYKGEKQYMINFSGAKSKSSGDKILLGKIEALEERVKTAEERVKVLEERMKALEGEKNTSQING